MQKKQHYFSAQNENSFLLLLLFNIIHQHLFHDEFSIRGMQRGSLQQHRQQMPANKIVHVHPKQLYLPQGLFRLS